MKTIYTIGHSNRELSDFIELLRINTVSAVVDVRKMPRSRSNPQFNGPELSADLARHGISYHHLEALTGFRSKSALTDRSVIPWIGKTQKRKNQGGQRVAPP